MRAGQLGISWWLITLLLNFVSWVPFYIAQFRLEEENPTKQNYCLFAIRTQKYSSHTDLGVCVEARTIVGRERGVGDQDLSPCPGPTMPPCSAMSNIYWTSPGKVAKSTLCPSFLFLLNTESISVWSYSRGGLCNYFVCLSLWDGYLEYKMKSCSCCSFKCSVLMR